MAKPTDIYDFATDVGATTDPGSARKATGFVAGKKAPAKWFNWLHNGAARWHAYLGNLHGEPEFLNKLYDWTGEHIFSGAVRLGPDTELEYDGLTRLRKVLLPLRAAGGTSGSSPGWVFAAPDDGVGFACADPGQRLTFLVGPDIIPTGARLKRVRASVNASASGTLFVWQVLYDTSAPGSGSNIFDGEYTLAAGATAEKWMTVTCDRLWDNAVHQLIVAIDANASPGFALRWIEIEFEDPGPRNF